MIVWLTAAALMAAGTGATGGHACTAAKEARVATVDAAYSRAEAQFLERLDEVGLVGSTLARPAVPDGTATALRGGAPGAVRTASRTPRGKARARVRASVRPPLS